MTTKRRNRQTTKHKILQAVGEALAQRGIEKAGINVIADLSGYNKVLVYRYFGGRNGLYESYMTMVLTNLENQVANMDPAVNELTHYVYTFLLKFAELIATSLPIRQLISWKLQNPELELTRQLEQIQQGVVNRLTENLTQSETALVQLVLSGIIYQLLQHPDQLETVHRQLTTLFMSTQIPLQREMVAV